MILIHTYITACDGVCSPLTPYTELHCMKKHTIPTLFNILPALPPHPHTEWASLKHLTQQYEAPWMCPLLITCISSYALLSRTPHICTYTISYVITTTFVCPRYNCTDEYRIEKPVLVCVRYGALLLGNTDNHHHLYADSTVLLN